MPTPTSPIDFTALAANLDEALSRLPAADRSAIALRFLSGQGFAEVGASLGISEDAAKKRVARALERLRDQLSRRGVTSPADLLERNLLAFTLLPGPDALTTNILTACHGAPSVTVLTLSHAAQLSLFAGTSKALLLAAGVLLVSLAAAVTITVEMLTPAPAKQAIAIPPTPALTPTTNAEISGHAYIAGDLRRTGPYAISGFAPLSLRRAIQIAGLKQTPDRGIVTVSRRGIAPPDPANWRLMSQGPVPTEWMRTYSLRRVMNGSAPALILQQNDIVLVQNPAPGRIAATRATSPAQSASQTPSPKSPSPPAP